MRAVLLTLLFGFAANLDNVGVGLAYGAMRRPISSSVNLLIALSTTIITLCALAGGIVVREVLPAQLPSLLGGSLLIALAGLTFWTDGASEKVTELPRTSRRFADRHTVGLAETMWLSLTLSINNIGLAFAGGVGGLDSRMAAASVFTFSLILLASGQFMACILQRLTRLSRLMNGHAVLALVGVLMLAGY
jgi:putative Mn2+ efflux pump MntP